MSDSTTSNGTIRDDSLVFGVAEQRYALPIAVVREVLPRASVVRVAEAPDELLGLLRLRGTLLPVVDPRRRLGLPPTAPRISQRIVVVRTPAVTIGLLVDAIHGLARLGEPGAVDGDRVLSGVVETPDGTIALLNPALSIGAETVAYLRSLLGGELTGPAGAAFGRTA